MLHCILKSYSVQCYLSLASLRAAAAKEVPVVSLFLTYCNIHVVVSPIERYPPVYLCFIGFTKAFDMIITDQLCLTMLEMGFRLN